MLARSSEMNCPQCSLLPHPPTTHPQIIPGPISQPRSEIFEICERQKLFLGCGEPFKIFFSTLYFLGWVWFIQQPDLAIDVIRLVNIQHLQLSVSISIQQKKTTSIKLKRKEPFEENENIKKNTCHLSCLLIRLISICLSFLY